jgi:hypothetical protein
MINETALEPAKSGATVRFLNETQVIGATEKCVSMSVSRSSDTTANLQGTFTWSKSIQGAILSAYYYGYILTQVVMRTFFSRPSFI